MYSQCMVPLLRRTQMAPVGTSGTAFIRVVPDSLAGAMMSKKRTSNLRRAGIPDAWRSMPQERC